MINTSKVTECDPCIGGKMSNGSMPPKSRLRSIPGEVVHTDVCTMQTVSVGSARYFVSFQDEASGT